MEKKLTLDEQIERLKNYYGVKFNICNEEQAKKYLSKNTYYAKIRCYLNSFERYQEDYRKHKLVNVEFEHVLDLAKIDMYLRKIVISISLDVEHFCKSFFMKEITEDDNFDGYSLVEELKGYYDYAILLEKAKGIDYTKFSLDRFNSENNIYNLIEILSFSGFIKMFDLYRGEKFDFESNLMFLCKQIRNASAHNNMLIHNLKQDDDYIFNKNQQLKSYLTSRLKLKNKTVKRLMSYPVTHDLCAAIILLKMYASDGIIKKNFEDLDVFIERVKKNKDYYNKQIHLTKILEDFEIFYKKIKLL